MILKVGLIGLGHQTVSMHIPALLASNRVEICGIVDANTSIAENISKKLRVHYYKDVDSLLSMAKPDFILIAVPHSEYLPIIEKAAQNGIHVLKEKPLSLDFTEGKKIEKIATEYKIEIMLTLQRRFNPVYSRFKEELGKTNDIFFFESKYSLSINNPHEGWRGSKKLAGGGCIMDMGYHMIDLLIWYFGLPNGIVSEFSARAKPNEVYDAEDTAAILIKYKKFYGNILFSRVIPPKTELLKVVSATEILELCNGEFSRYNTEGKLLEKVSDDLSKIEIAKKQLDYFCDVLEKKRKNEYNPNYHLQHMAFIQSCYESQKQGKFINPNNFL